MARDESAFSAYHVEGGDGHSSYRQNSTYQKQAVDSGKEMMNQLIHQHLRDISPGESFNIADFGCAVGPNTIIAVDNIISAVKSKYKSSPEFHVFFNDHVENDFNSLFRNLPAAADRTYFAAGVPGTFHGRLFPNSSLHFAHCSISLHWLSKIPEEVKDAKSAAWNGGRILYAGAAREVKEAYSGQYRKDLDCFLTARGREVVPGGLMVLTVMGFPEGVELAESTLGETFNLLSSCLQDMAKEGLVDEALVNSFNLPFYYPSAPELKALVEANGWFEVERLEELVLGSKTEKPDLRVHALHLRAVLGGLIKQYFGEEIVEDLFRRQLEKYLNSPIIADLSNSKEAQYFVFLKRKVDP